jgi:hypothetical protein
MNAPVRIAAIFACLLLLAGCDSISTDKPIGASPETQTDARLIGEWTFVFPPDEKMAADERGYGFFLPQKDGGFRGVAVAWSAATKQDSGDLSFNALTGKAGDFWFLNVQNIANDGKPDNGQPRGYRPYLYRIEDGTLRIFEWSPEGLEKLTTDIEQGRLEGTVTVSGRGKDPSGTTMKTTTIEISADQKALDAYFAANADKIFTKRTFTLKRQQDR